MSGRSGRSNGPARPGGSAGAAPRRLVFYEEAIEYGDGRDEIPIGVVVPFDFPLDRDYWRYVPEGVSLHFTRTPRLNDGVGLALAEELGRADVVARAAEALIAVDPVVTAYACASGSFVRGLAGERDVRRALLEGGARRAVTSSGAMLDALRACGARRVAVAAPYTESLTGRAVEFLEEAGFEVVQAAYLGLSGSMAAVSQSTVAALVHAASRPEADVVAAMCTSLRTHGILAAVERCVGRPVLTSNQVTLWAALRAAGALRAATVGVLGDGDVVARSTRMLLGGVAA